MPLLQSELTVDLTYHPDLGETTKVLDDYSTYQQHKHAADDLPEDIVTARVVSHLQRELVIALVRYQNEVVPIMLDPASSKVEEIADDLALENLRCDRSAKIASWNRRSSRSSGTGPSAHGARSGGCRRRRRCSTCVAACSVVGRRSTWLGALRGYVASVAARRNKEVEHGEVRARPEP